MSTPARRNAVDKSKRSSLHVAALLGKAKALAALLDAGLELDFVVNRAEPPKSDSKNNIYCFAISPRSPFSLAQIYFWTLFLALGWPPFAALSCSSFFPTICAIRIALRRCIAQLLPIRCSRCRLFFFTRPTLQPRTGLDAALCIWQPRLEQRDEWRCCWRREQKWCQE